VDLMKSMSLQRLQYRCDPARWLEFRVLPELKLDR